MAEQSIPHQSSKQPGSGSPARGGQAGRSDAAVALRLMAVKVAIFVLLPFVVAIAVVLWVGV